jgi:hypothetical protein
MAVFAERRLRDEMGDAWVDKLVVEHNGHSEVVEPLETETAEPAPAAPEPPTASDA